MKLTFVFITVALLVLATASPTKKDEAKKAVRPSSNKKPCLKECNLDYQPICASDNKDKPKSFGSVCVLDNYNCEHETKLAKISDGECPGGGGVRLS